MFVQLPIVIKKYYDIYTSFSAMDLLLSKLWLLWYHKITCGVSRCTVPAIRNFVLLLLYFILRLMMESEVNSYNKIKIYRLSGILHPCITLFLSRKIQLICTLFTSVLDVNNLASMSDWTYLGNCSSDILVVVCSSL